jgi:hypothetical protein
MITGLTELSSTQHCTATWQLLACVLVVMLTKVDALVADVLLLVQRIPAKTSNSKQYKAGLAMCQTGTGSAFAGKVQAAMQCDSL